MNLTTLRRLSTAALLAAPASVFASGLNGSELGLPWAVPFAGILLSIALLPLIVPHIWHHHFGKIAVFWALCAAVPMWIIYGDAVTIDSLAHIMLGDYVPFLIFVGSLFVVAGGIHIKGSFVGRPFVNVIFLAIGAVLANFMGTTGAAMLLIRPLINANRDRKFKMHTFIFFIFLVANIGGSLTPLGDPPLFLGFLKGVTFSWTAVHLIAPWLTTVGILLAIYFAIDSVAYAKDVKAGFKPESNGKRFAVTGLINIPLLALIIGAVLLSGFWHPGYGFEFRGVHFALENLVRDALFLTAAGLSLAYTSRETREANHFTWDPIVEVGKLFFGIFTCIVPVLEMLRAGDHGAFASVVALVSNPDGTFNNTVFFWLTGILSAFLDNAPTYLAFFNLAGGDAASLMTEHIHTLMAISMGSVFMGAVSYIGNAPNFMTVAICKERGIHMPSFFGYMVWSVGILFPVFAFVDWMFVA